MDDEVELFECQIAEGLMTIGWIHTHPQFVSLFTLILTWLCLVIVGLVLILSGPAQSIWLSDAATRGNCNSLLTNCATAWLPSL